MMIYFLRKIFISSLFLFTFQVIAQEAVPPVDLVNTHIGGISHMLMPTFPTVHRPCGMVRTWPVTSPGVPDAYLAPKIYGFPLNPPEHRGHPCTTVMPVIGRDRLSSGKWESSYDHDFENSTPY